MSTEMQQLKASIEALESQRETLGDAVVDSLLAPARAKLAELATKSQTEPQQTIKQATILFMDIVGSTPLSQQLDPEEFHAIVDSVLVRGTAEVQNRGGKIISYAGDNLIAVFGGVAAREDAAESAVKAGLALLHIGRSLHDQVLERFKLDGSNVRVGIHTGTVLLGGGVQADNTISGMNVNIAARMEQTAPPGALRISNTTYAMVRGVFDVEPQPPIDVKGLSEPMTTYLVLGTRPRAFRVASRGIEGVETRMVARDTELGALQKVFELLWTERRLSVVTVVGDAGVGKSRLLYEFENWADGRPESFTFFQGRANPQTVSQPYGLLRDVLAWRFQIADDTPMQDAKDRLVAGISPLFADDGPEMQDSHAHLLGQLIGLDFSDSPHVQGILEDAKQIRNRGFHAVAQMFRRIAATTGNPIVLQLEDLHWADSGSLDFVLHLGKVNSDVPLMVIGLTRDTLFERRKDWFPSDSGHQRLDLQPLDQSASAMLAGELLKKIPHAPASLLDLIKVRSEGNPFYMEELVKMLIDQGAIQIGTAEEEFWQVNPEKLLATTIPATLVGVLQARLDSLPTAERLAMQQSSVIGLVFWDRALAALDEQSVEALPSLVDRDLTRPQLDGRTEGLREYVFKHQILHQVTYDTLLKRHRKELHAKAADWLAHQSGPRAKDFLGIAAQHYEHADDVANAVEFYARATEYAKSGYSHLVALEYANAGLELLNQCKGFELEEATFLAMRWRLLDVRERTFELQGRREEQRSCLAELEGVANALNDDRLRADLAFRQTYLALRTNDISGMEIAARRSISLAQSVGDQQLRLKGVRMLGVALAYLGDPIAGNHALHEGLEEAQRLGLRRVEGNFLNALSVFASQTGELEAPLRLLLEALAVAREFGDRVGEVIDVLNVGVIWFNLGQWEQADRVLHDALQLSRMVGDRSSEGKALQNLSRLAHVHKMNDQALFYAREALNIAVAIQDGEEEALACWAAGEAELSVGHFAEATAYFAKAQRVASDIGDADVEADGEAGLAMTALKTEDLQIAMSQVESLLKKMTDGGALVGSLSRSVDLACFQVLEAANDPRAFNLLERAHGALQGQALAITDVALRDSFLTNIPEHREIVNAWERHISLASHESI